MTLTCGQARSGMCWQAAALGRVVHLPAGNIISQHNNRPVATAPAGRRPKPSGARLPDARRTACQPV